MVIYPPVETTLIEKASKGLTKEDYFLIVSRLVGSKGLVEAVRAAKHLGIKMKIVGGTEAVSGVANEIYKLAGDGVEVLGRISDDELFTVYAKARGFIALARNEDFGMTVVEAMAAGTPVIAFNGGGFVETIVDGETGILIDNTDVATMEKAFKRFGKIKWDKEKLQKQARKFSRERFEEKIRKVIGEYAGTARG